VITSGLTLLNRSEQQLVRARRRNLIFRNVQSIAFFAYGQVSSLTHRVAFEDTMPPDYDSGNLTLNLGKHERVRTSKTPTTRRDTCAAFRERVRVPCSKILAVVCSSRSRHVGSDWKSVGARTMELLDFLVREAIITDLRATTKEAAIREIG
jgi:hypothetical protein